MYFVGKLTNCCAKLIRLQNAALWQNVSRFATFAFVRRDFLFLVVSFIDSTECKVYNLRYVLYVRIIYLRWCEWMIDRCLGQSKLANESVFLLFHYLFRVLGAIFRYLWLWCLDSSLLTFDCRKFNCFVMFIYDLHYVPTIRNFIWLGVQSKF